MRWTYLIAGFLLLFSQAKAQDTLLLPLTDVLKMAESGYPKLKASRYELEAAKENVKFQKQSSVPKLDVTYQANLATYNNLTGMYLSQYVLPISGPPTAENNYSPVTGSAASLLFQWQPLTFGERKSKINLALASSETLQSRNDLEIFDHKVRVSSQYLDEVYFQQLLRIYEENILISESQLQQVKVLALTGLKPGVDTALIGAELSSARIEGLKIRNTLNGVLSDLRQSLACDSVIVGKDSLFFSLMPEGLISDTSEHPAKKRAMLSVEENKLKRIVIGKQTAPHLSFWGSTYARGSGVHYDGSYKTLDGFSLNRFNYGAGLQLAIPLLNHAEVNTLIKQQDWIVQAEQEKLNQVSLELREQRRLAETTFSNALAVARETPVRVHSAEYAFDAMQIRYAKGLVNYSELLQTQSDLLKARIELAQSRVELWKALLYKAAVYGDLNLFINQVR